MQGVILTALIGKPGNRFCLSANAAKKAGQKHYLIKYRLMASANTIQVSKVSKSFGEIKALINVDLAVPKGKIFALLGPNGAGKTTLIRILTTLLLPDKGKATVAGHNVLTAPQEVRKSIGLAGQYAAVDDNLTGQENLEMIGRLYHLSKAEAKARARSILNELGLSKAANRPSKTYSGGMRRRLDLGASFIYEPEVLFLDEPTTGLDPHARVELWRIIRKLKDAKKTVLLTTQYLEEAEELADHIAIIDQGSVIAKGTVEHLRKQIGGNVLELHLSDKKDLDKAKTTLTKLKVRSKDIIESKLETHLSIRTQKGQKFTVEIVRAFDKAGIKIDDLHLRKPSLNEVFLKLTGSGVES